MRGEHSPARTAGVEVGEKKSRKRSAAIHLARSERVTRYRRIARFSGLTVPGAVSTGSV
jgi:hypothetical protein